MKNRPELKIQVSQEDGDIKMAFQGGYLDNKAIQRSILLANCRQLVCHEETATVQTTLPIHPKSFLLWYQFDKTELYSASELCETAQVADFLQDNSTSMKISAVLTRRLRTALLAALQDSLLNRQQLPPVVFAWQSLSHLTSLLKDLPPAALHAIASQFHVNELLAAPQFLVRACLQSIEPAGVLDLSSLSLSDGSAHTLRALLRILSEASHLNFAHLRTPRTRSHPPGTPPRLEHALRNFSPLPSVTSLDLSFSSIDSFFLCSVLRMLPNLCSLRAGGFDGRFSLDEVSQVTTVLANARHLQCLDMSWCGLHLHPLAQCCAALCQSLTSLRLPTLHCRCPSHTTGAVLQNTLPHLTHLKSLKFSIHSHNILSCSCMRAALPAITHLSALTQLHIAHNCDFNCAWIFMGDLLEMLAHLLAPLRRLKDVCVSLPPSYNLDGSPFQRVSETQMQVFDTWLTTMDKFVLEVPNSCSVLFPFLSKLHSTNCIRSFVVTAEHMPWEEARGPWHAPQLWRSLSCLTALTALRVTFEEPLLEECANALHDALGHLLCLQNLELRWTRRSPPWTHSLLPQVFALPHLQSLRMHGSHENKKDGWDTALHEGVAMAASLTCLDLQGVHREDSEGVVAVVQQLTGLRSLLIWSLPVSQVACNGSFLRSLENLEMLDLDLSGEVSVEEARCIGTSLVCLSHLTTLVVRSGIVVRDAAEVLSACVGQLQRLEECSWEDGCGNTLALPQLCGLRIPLPVLWERCMLRRGAQHSLP